MDPNTGSTFSDSGTDLRKEDYVEPNCVLCGEPYGAAPKIRSIPQQRIIEKMDEYMSRRDYSGAERHLLYWLEEAKLGKDKRGELMLRNELTGHYRKTGEKDKSLENASLALQLLKELDMEDTISAGTSYVNAATAHQAFGMPKAALSLFEKAKAVYENASGTRPELLGGLYNNMALTEAALGNYRAADDLWQKAMKEMGQLPNGVLEQAITCLNMANAAEDEYGLTEAEPRIFELLDKAEELLETPGIPHDGYYAFVCEKCAPTFSYYGYFVTAEKLGQISAEIYRKNS